VSGHPVPAAAAEFGAHLRRLRTAAGRTQKDVGAKVHYSKSQISGMERGRRLPLKDLARALDDVLDGHGELLASWYRSRAACHPAEGRSADVVRSTAYDGGGTRVSDAAAFAAGMKLLKLGSELSYRRISRRSGLPSSTLHEICQGLRKSLPSTVQVEAFLKAVGVGEPERRGWLEALTRIRVGDPAGNERAWLRRAAEGGEPDAVHRFARDLLAAGEAREAERWFRRAAEAGHIAAMDELGTLCRKGNRLGEAEKWWRRAALAGSAGAMNNLALLLHMEGEEEAEDWHRRAAAAGSLDAMHNLALIAEERGRPEEAERWYGMAARAGDDDAMENLAAIYRARGDLPQAGLMRSLAQRLRAED